MQIFFEEKIDCFPFLAWLVSGRYGNDSSQTRNTWFVRACFDYSVWFFAPEMSYRDLRSA
jgi:hypothetical protein